jgi:hypothetical protein
MKDKAGSMFFSPRAIATAASVLIFAASPVSPAFAAGALPWSDATHDFVTISVGGGKPVPVIFDTGSVGLVIYQSGVGKGAKPTKDPATTKSFPGRVYHVTYADAKVSIAGITTTAPVKIGVVHSITCSKPGCKSAKTTAQLSNIPAGQPYGILGVGFGSSELENPMLALPSPYSSGFVVRDSGIQVGLAGASGFSKPLKLATASGSASGNYKTYNKYFKACFTIAGTKMKNSCVQTMFDTGVPGINIPPSFAGTLPSGNLASRVQVPGVFDMSFEGGTTSKTFVFNQPATTHANLGLPFLLDYDVQLDFTTGTYRFRKHPTTGTKRTT